MNNKKSDNNLLLNLSSNKELMIGGIGLAIAVISLFFNFYLLASKQSKVIFFNQDDILMNIMLEAQEAAAKLTKAREQQLAYISKKAKKDLARFKKKGISKSEKNKIQNRIKNHQKRFAKIYQEYSEAYRKVEQQYKQDLAKRLKATLLLTKRTRKYSLIGVGGVRGIIRKKEDATDEILKNAGIENRTKKLQEQEDEEEKNNEKKSA